MMALAWGKKAEAEKWPWTDSSSVRDREVLCDAPLCVVGQPRMFCFLKGVSAPSLEQSGVRGVSAGWITSQAELMAPDREERGWEELREVEKELWGGDERQKGEGGVARREMWIVSRQRRWMDWWKDRESIVGLREWKGETKREEGWMDDRNKDLVERRVGVGGLLCERERVAEVVRLAVC